MVRGETLQRELSRSLQEREIESKKSEAPTDTDGEDEGGVYGHMMRPCRISSSAQ